MLPLCFILVGAGIAFSANEYKIGTVSNPGAGFFPLVIGIGLICTGLVEVKNISRKAFHVADETGTPEKVDIYRIIGVIFLLLLWPALLSSLGYALITFVVTFLLAEVFRMESHVKACILALITTLAVHYVFKVWFYLDLPDGLLIDWIKDNVALGGINNYVKL